MRRTIVRFEPMGRSVGISPSDGKFAPIPEPLMASRVENEDGYGSEASAARSYSREAPMDNSPCGRVAIVEDDALMAQFLEETLEDAGYEVVGMAATADDAVSLIGWQRPDLALLDIRLRGRRNG